MLLFWKRLQRKRVGRFSLTSLLTFWFVVHFTGLTLWWALPAFANTTALQIEPITWDMVGLDSNKPESQGPNTYVVGARVCNVGSADAVNVRTRFVKDGVDNGYTYIQLQASDTYTFPVIPKDNGANPISAASYRFDAPINGSLQKSKYALNNTPSYCQDFYYNFEVTRSPSAHHTYQKYYIETWADNAAVVTTPRPRQIYIEQMISQARNYIYDFACDAGSGYQSGAVSVEVGDVFKCRARAHTASAYPQVSFTADIPNVIFQMLDVSTTYSSPTGGKNSTVYADGCGWVQNPTDPRYHRSPSACEGESGGNGEVYSDQYPFGSTKGAVGNTIETTYTIKVLAFPSGVPNPIQVSNIILDYSGSSYHYNADYGIGTNIINITVNNPTPTDLSIAKSHIGNFSYGANAYNIAIANSNGADAKAPVTFTDTLPAGYQATGLSGPDAAKWACSLSGQVLSCTYNNGTPNDNADDDFPRGATNNLVLNVNVDQSSAATNSTNFVQISASNDNNPANNTDSDPTTVLSGADLALAKTHTPSTFLVGGVGTYQLTVTNTGNLDANPPLTITDTLPGGLLFDSFDAANSSPNWSCSNSGQTVICQNASDSLDGSDAPDPAGGTANVAFKVKVTSGVAVDGTGQAVKNTATVSSQTLDTNSANNTAVDPTPTAVPAPDLTITKTDFGAVVVSGGTVEYEITVTNVGSNATTGVVTVTDTLNAEYDIATAGSVIAPGYPAGNTTYNQYVNAGWQCSLNSTTRVLTCQNFAPIPAGASSTYRIRLTDSTASSGTPSNTATVTTVGETNTANNSATDTTPLGTSGSNQDVSVKKCFDSEITDAEATGNITANILCGTTTSESFSYETVGTPAITPGSTVTYEIIVGNESPAGNTDGASFEDILPPGLEFPAGNSSFGWRCEPLNTGASQGTNACSPTSASFPTSGLSQTLPIQLPRISLKKLSGGNPKLPGRVRIFVTARVKANFSGTLSNTANVSALDSSGNILIDSTPANNVSSRIVSTLKPDLVISKSHSGNFSQGTEGTYTLTVTNNTATSDGPTTKPIVITDQLPVSGADKAFNFVSASGTGWSCNYDGATHRVLCTYPSTLAKGASAQLQIKVIPTRAGSFTNTVEVFTANDKNTANNTASDPTTVLAPNVDLSLTKTPQAAAFELGQEATYRLEVRNHNVGGATAATAPITLVDRLPAGLNFLYSQTLTGSPWVCSATTDADGNGSPDGYETVTCTRYTPIAPGESAQVDLKVLVSGSAPTGPNAITNQARVTSSSDPCADFTCASANNRATAPTTINPASDLAIEKSTSGSFVAGETGLYSLKVTNLGPSNYGGTVEVSDTLPGGLTFNPTGSGGGGFSCSASGQTVTCAKAGGLLAGESRQFALVVTIASGASGSSLRNTASFASATLTSANDPTGDSNDSSFVDVTIAPNTSNLSLAKDDGDGETPDEPTNSQLQTKFSQGGSGKYTLVVTNGGPASAKQPVQVSDNLPSGLTYAGYSLTSNWRCTGTVGSSSFSCTYGQWSDTNGDGDRFNDANGFTPLNMTAGVTSGVEVVVNVDSGAAVGTRTNTAQVTSSNGGSASGSETTVIIAPADLQVEKAGLATATAGGTGSYTLTVTNLGPGTSEPDIYLTDYLPVGMSYSGFSGSGWSLVNYNDSANEVTFKRTSSLAPGAAVPLTLNVSIASNAPATVRNLVRVSGFAPEPDNPDRVSCDRTFATQPVNNCAVQETQISGGLSTDLSIIKAHDVNDTVESAPYNLPFIYHLQVANLGGQVAEGVSLQDVLPSSLEFVSISLDPGDVSIANPFGPGSLTRNCGYNSSNRTVSCNLINLSVGENASDPVDIYLTVKGLISGQIPNTATVTSLTADSNASNNRDDERVEILNVPTSGLNIISGRVFADANENQSPDGGEAGIANAEVEVYQDNGSILGAVDPGDTLIGIVLSDAQGDYSLSLALQGNFVMAVNPASLPSGTSFTTDNVETASFDALPDTPNSDQNNNFGLKGVTTSGGQPQLLLVKRITAVNGDRTANPNDNTPLNQVLDDTTSPVATHDNHPNWPDGYLVGQLNAGLIKPGDTLEYTVYYLNAGNAGAAAVRMCDWIQPNQRLVLSQYGGSDVELQVGEGTGSSTYGLTAAADAADRLQLATVGTLPPGLGCNLPAAASNPNDEVLVMDLTGTSGEPASLSSLPASTGKGTPDSAFGFFRFTAQVK